MKPLFTLVSSICLLISSQAALAQDQQASIKPWGIRIADEGYGESKYGKELRPFNWSKGTTISLFITNPGGGLIDIDEDNSKITKCADDKGTDLVGKKTSSYRSGARMSFSKVAKDGKAGTIEVNTNEIPVTGATAITLEGEMALIVAKESETKKTAKPVKIENAAKGSIGQFNFSISGVKSGGKRFSLNFNQDIGDIAEIVFMNAAGEVIDAKSRDSSRTRIGKMIKHEKNFEVDTPAAELVIQFKIWKDRNIEKIAFKQTFSLGL